MSIHCVTTWALPILELAPPPRMVVMTTRDTLLKCSIAAWTVGACDFLGFLAYARHWWGATCWKMCCVHVREGEGVCVGEGGG